jgi:hypothetical protein
VRANGGQAQASATSTRCALDWVGAGWLLAAACYWASRGFCPARPAVEAPAAPSRATLETRYVAVVVAGNWWPSTLVRHGPDAIVATDARDARAAERRTPATRAKGSRALAADHPSMSLLGRVYRLFR